MLEKILVAVDGSEYSLKALDYALELGERFDGKITLIHVYGEVFPIQSENAAPVANMATKEAKRAGEEILNQAEQRAKKDKISVDKVLRKGDVVKEIVAVAQERSFDLIAIGHKGITRFQELFLGSVSEGVSHKA